MYLFTVLFILCLSHNLQAQTITLWEGEKTSAQQALDELIERFQRENPNITIKRKHFAKSILQTQFQTSAIGDDGADLVLASNDVAASFASMGVIKPIETWADIKNFNQVSVAAVSDESKTTWGLPVARGNFLLLYYNKRFVKTPPKTIEALIKWSKVFTDFSQSRYGFAYNLNEPLWFAAVMGAYDSKPLINNRPDLNNANTIRALSLVKDLKFKEKIVPKQCPYGCADALFIDSNAAIIINGDWALDKYRHALGDSLGASSLPFVEATGKPMRPMVGGKYLFFNESLKGRKYKAAQKFANYLTSIEVQKFLIEKAHLLPTRVELETSPELKSDPLVYEVFKAMENAQPAPMALEMKAVWQAMAQQLQAVMSGKADPKVAVIIMQNEATTKIKGLR